ncbi:putative GNTR TRANSCRIPTIONAL REGULATOR [Vibrio nigripulchritudo SO65]|uniref:aminotransferase-like domain-containing protein n=1 Tax=Vibrio nigripulchritudo TaxID=28173 RepID=UPI0003B22D72|nr:PLP-dependent aminotransferase family protein [Vibrio nigripulchritudo]CCN38287.1 putative GNTR TRANSCRIPTIONAL REGULATOR [Vibrio nigripulchritudo AM115]CCN43471.1 putative GNTR TRANSCRIPTIONAL REGULATOR [Vibrio nigripulchritudo FTn2]CCN65779.1 putative GNTR TRANSCRIPTIONAL REGULATOR [Vibrio nigripulchritudo POn4]CCN75326.1 putative GNTR TRANSCRIPTIONAL REGULATOR [Vibrio nigripulchritudo SO65]
MSMYRTLASRFIREIEAGKLAEGSRMPSLRQFSKQQAVSMSTAVSCYQELESQGWIHARPQAGYYVSPQRSKHNTPEWASFVSKVSSVNQNFAIHSQHNGPLGVSSTTIDDVSLNELERSFRRASKRIGNRLNQYPDTQGEPLLRNALSDHFSRLGLNFTPSELVITSGCMPAIKAALESCSQVGDAIAISSPCFSGILDLLGQMGRKIVEIPSLDDGIDLAQLENHLKKGVVKAGVFCTSHMNPQGITMSAAQKQKLADLANFYQVPIIEDDVYLELSYSEHTPLPAKYYDQGGYILWCGSVSKSLSPSYRLGWCMPGRYTNQYCQKHAASCFGISLPMQLAMADFIESGHYAKQLKRRRSKLLQLRQTYLSYLSDRLPENVNISHPQGGMVLWLQVPTLNVTQFTSLLEASKIDIRLGHLFSTLSLYDNCFRINFGFELTKEVQKELDVLIDAVRRAC